MEPQPLGMGYPVGGEQDPFAAINPNPAVAPPATPEELQTRVTGWKKLLNEFTTNPALIMGTLRFGTEMMQPRAPGQTGAGQLGAALSDSVNYASAARMSNEENARKNMLAQSQSGLEGARTTAVTQETAQKEKAFPTALEQAQATLEAKHKENRKTQYELDQLAASTEAGLNTPAYLRRKSELEINKGQSLIDMYNAHANYYNQTASQLGDKTSGQQMKVDNPDGTTSILYTHIKKGQRYIESVTPAAYTDEKQAKDRAQKEVDKETPFFGQAPYQGTKADEVSRRMKRYMTPSRQIIGPGGQVVTPEQFNAIDASEPRPQGGAKAIGAELAGQTNVDASLSGGGDIGANLKMVDAELARPNLHPVALKALEDEKVRLLNAQQGRATEIGPEGARAAGGPTNVERGPDGRLRITGSGQTGQPKDPGDFASGVLGGPTSKAAQSEAARQARGEKKATDVQKVQADFEKDRKALEPQALLAKYGQGSDLTDQQRAVLFKIRNK